MMAKKPIEVEALKHDAANRRDDTVVDAGIEIGLLGDQRDPRGCFRHQLLLPRHYLVLTKPLRLDIQCQRGASVKIGWKYLEVDD